MTGRLGAALGPVVWFGATVATVVAVRHRLLRRRARARFRVTSVSGTTLGGVHVPPAAAAVVGSAMAFAFVRLMGTVPSIAIIASGGVAWWARAAQARARAARALTYELPEVLDALVGVLRSGGGMLDGLASAHALPLDSRVRAELGTVLLEVDRGGSLVGALRGWAQRSQSRDLTTVVGLIDSASRTGGPVADALGAVSSGLRGRRAQEREVAALVSQARLSAMVLVVLPIGVVPLFQILGVTRVEVILADPLSRVGIVCGIALDLVGLWWMRRLIDRIET